ncbi:MAG: hypothetical protein ABW068_01945 [Candidatus Thiodiazotropha sp.]
MWHERILDLIGAVFVVLAMILLAFNESSRSQTGALEEGDADSIPATLKTRSPSAHPSTNVCAAMPIDAILATVGGTGPMGTKSHTDDRSDCSYRFKTNSLSGSPVGWVVNVQVWDASTWGYQRSLPSPRRKEITGLGDGAFTQAGKGERTLWARHNDKVVSVTSADQDQSEALTLKIARLALTYW